MGIINAGAPPCDIKCWGNPFHGLVVDKQLTLPNSATKTLINQPQFGNGCRCYATPSEWGYLPDRSDPRDAAIDADNGFVWENYAIIHEFKYIYDEYIGPYSTVLLKDSSTGKIYSAAIFTMQSTNFVLQVDVIFKEFGRFTKTPVDALPTIFDTESAYLYLRTVVVIDSKRDGSQVLIGAFEDGYLKQLFTLDLTVSGGVGSVNVSLYRDESQLDTSTYSENVNDATTGRSYRYYIDYSGTEIISDGVNDYTSYIGLTGGFTADSTDNYAESGPVQGIASWTEGSKTRTTDTTHTRAVWAGYDASDGIQIANLHQAGTVVRTDNYASATVTESNLVLNIDTFTADGQTVYAGIDDLDVDVEIVYPSGTTTQTEATTWSLTFGGGTLSAGTRDELSLSPLYGFAACRQVRGRWAGAIIGWNETSTDCPIDAVDSIDSSSDITANLYSVRFYGKVVGIIASTTSEQSGYITVNGTTESSPSSDDYIAHHPVTDAVVRSHLPAYFI